MRIAVKEVGKELQIMDVKDQYRIDLVKKFTGKGEMAEFVRLNQEGTFCAGINENGLMLNLPLNFLLAIQNPHFPIVKMVGTVVFVRHKYVDVWKEEIWDYEVTDLTDEDIRMIKLLLDEDLQQRLREKFCDYGTGFTVFEKI